MRLRLVVVRNAEREIRNASKWWDENRTLAPDLFREELARGFELITTQPQIGSAAVNTRVEGVRRLHLGRTHYYLYYRIKNDEEEVEVLGLWHTSQSAPPRI